MVSKRQRKPLRGGVSKKRQSQLLSTTQQCCPHGLSGRPQRPVSAWCKCRAFLLAMAAWDCDSRRMGMRVEEKEQQEERLEEAEEQQQQRQQEREAGGVRQQERLEEQQQQEEQQHEGEAGGGGAAAVVASAGSSA